MNYFNLLFLPAIFLYDLLYELSAATKKFETDRSQLMALRAAKAVKGPQDPFGLNYSYIRWLPGRHDPAPPVPHFVNPALYRVDREYSNKPPYMLAYDRRLFRRMPNVFITDADYSTTTYT